MNHKTMSVIASLAVVVLIALVIYFVVSKKSEFVNVDNQLIFTDGDTQPTSRTDSMATTTGFETRTEGNEMALYRLMSNGVLVKTGLKVVLSRCGREADGAIFYCPENIVVSPDNTKAVYSTWKSLNYEIFVSNIDGTQSKKIAEQEASEGQGKLYVETLRWSSDGKFITYGESRIVSIDPDRSIGTTYKVNIENGTKIQLSESNN